MYNRHGRPAVEGRGLAQERRGSERVETAPRSVYFSITHDDGPIRPGTLRNMSGSGLWLDTPEPADPGARVHIEIPARRFTGEDSLCFTGQVVRVRMGQGQLPGMAVHLTMPLAPMAGRIHEIRTKAPAHPETAPARRRAAALVTETEDEVHASGLGQSDIEAATPRRSARRRKPLLALTMLALFAALFLWWATREGENSTGLFSKRQASAGNPTGFEPWLGGESPEFSTERAGETAGLRGAASTRRVFREVRPLNVNVEGETPEPARFQAPSRHAPAGVDDSETGLATGFRAPVTMTAALGLNPDGSGTGPYTLELRPVRNDERLQPPAQGVAIVVSKSRFQLTLLRDGNVLREMTIGLGAGDATPTGRFEIANKLTDPDWYNRGEVVAAGDPANPLGRYWMGLGSDGIATPYGLHGTPELGSLGQARSRGCVRLSPGDAEMLFRFCPSGTPVIIQP